MDHGIRKNASAQYVTVSHAAVVVARRQYMPIQNGAANRTVNTHVSCNCAKTSMMKSEISTAPSTTTTPVMRPTRTYCFSEAFGLMYGA